MIKSTASAVSRRTFLRRKAFLMGGLCLPAALSAPTFFSQTLIASPAHAQSVALTLEQAQKLQEINVYFNTIRTMNGDFVQFDHLGRRSEGTFNLSRPGKMRFSYEPPARLEVVSDGGSVAVIDRGLDTQDIYPLGRTPLRFLVADYIDLTRDTKIFGVKVEPDIVTILIQSKEARGSGQISLMFDAKTNDLRQWIVTDDQNRATTVALYNVELDQPQAESLFKIKYRRPQAGNNNN